MLLNIGGYPGLSPPLIATKPPQICLQNYKNTVPAVQSKKFKEHFFSNIYRTFYVENILLILYTYTAGI